MRRLASASQLRRVALLVDVGRRRHEAALQPHEPRFRAVAGLDSNLRPASSTPEVLFGRQRRRRNVVRLAELGDRAGNGSDRVVDEPLGRTGRRPAGMPVAGSGVPAAAAAAVAGLSESVEVGLLRTPERVCQALVRSVPAAAAGIGPDVFLASPSEIGFRRLAGASVKDAPTGSAGHDAIRRSVLA